MTKKLFLEQLVKLNTCREATKWVAGQTLEEAWSACHRGDWMLWLAARVGVERKLILLAACACARQSLPRVRAGEERPRIAIETAERWAQGDESVSLDDVREAADAAYEAAAATAHAHAAADASAAAAAAAEAVTYVDYAAAEAAFCASRGISAAGVDYAAAVSDAAVYAANYSSSRSQSLAHSASLVRSIISAKVLKEALTVGQSHE